MSNRGHSGCAVEWSQPNMSTNTIEGSRVFNEDAHRYTGNKHTETTHALLNQEKILANFSDIPKAMAAYINWEIKWYWKQNLTNTFSELKHICVFWKIISIYIFIIKLHFYNTSVPSVCHAV